MIWSSLFAVVAGFALLVFGADRFVAGAASVARNLSISPLIIGLTIVGFGTSAPEMLVSAVASWQGDGGLAVGNALGSNITNIALVLGVAAVVAPMDVHSDMLRRELPMLLTTMLVALFLMIDGSLGFGDGLVLVSGMVAMITWVVRQGLRSRVSDPLTVEYEAELPARRSMPMSIIWLVAGLIILLVASRIVVGGAVNLAKLAGISDLVIGLTVIAVGTSLPELAATVMSARKNEHDIAIGNVIGSNMFNILAVLAMPALLAPGEFDHVVLVRDFPVMIGLTIALYVMAKGLHGRGRITRLEGAALLLVYIVYIGVLYIQGRPA